MSGEWRFSRRWGYVACAWGVAFAGLHLYWAVGGDVGLSVSAGPELATRRPAWFVMAGLWGGGALCVLGAALGWVLAREQPRNALVRRAVGGLGWAVAAVLLLRAVTIEVLLLTDVTHLSNAIEPDQRFWTLALWNPWFVTGGLSFALAALSLRRASAGTGTGAAEVPHPHP
ncbi:DUF3995 domain-containing protein [Streptomyces sp. NPDC051776]|uniref:DUF3995 domain-containing protein n=1 Tax=Streptomyces sp. NPDC051776 TaxID=3155414 RepID=UPI0034179C17